VISTKKEAVEDRGLAIPIDTDADVGHPIKTRIKNMDIIEIAS
jgi:hypothetical protein